ncbi:MAG: hypothetical protein JNM89_00345 [Hyphomicrobiaceae bacterium]|nr:hypothetical protein [Hyphomicrobiaceae bacterium]
MSHGISALTSHLLQAVGGFERDHVATAAIRAVGRSLLPVLLAVLAVMLAVVHPTPTLAQAGPGGLVNPQRDCQTVLACNFRRGGSYRGCISAYSCRTCRLKPARCSVGDRRRNCRKMACSWG